MKFTFILLGLLLSIHLNAQPLAWVKQYNGIWKAVVGKPEKVGLLNSVNAKASSEALDKLPVVKFPLTPTDIDAKIIDGKLYLRFPLDRDEQLFGLGLNFQTV